MKKLILIFICFVSFSNKAVGDDLKIIVNSPLSYSGPSTECKTEICIELLALIDHANSSIDFAIYGLRGQPHILDALIDAEKRGVRVRGIIDKTIDGESYYKDTYLLEEKLSNIKSDYQSDLETLNDLKDKKKSENKKCERPTFTDGPLQCFEGKGYASKEEIIFSGDIMHNKFFIVDNRFIWTGSANISDTDIGGYNANVVAVLDSPFFASFYQKEFDQMFIKGRHHRKK